MPAVIEWRAALLLVCLRCACCGCAAGSVASAAPAAAERCEQQQPCLNAISLPSHACLPYLQWAQAPPARRACCAATCRPASWNHRRRGGTCTLARARCPACACPWCVAYILCWATAAAAADVCARTVFTMGLRGLGMLPSSTVAEPFTSRPARHNTHIMCRSGQTATASSCGAPWCCCRT